MAAVSLKPMKTDVLLSRQSFASLAVALLVSATALGTILEATSAEAAPPEIAAVIRVGFTGSSSLHEWEGTASPVSTTLHASSTPNAWDGQFTVPIASLDSGNATRDSNMRAMFHSDRYPDIRVALRGVDPAAVQRDHALVASLTIGETTHDVTARIANWSQDGGRVGFDADAEVSLDAFGLEAPSVLGIVRVADIVKVTGHVELVVSQDPPAAEGKPK